MKKIILPFLITFLCSISFTQENFPKAKSFVNDQASIIDAKSKLVMENLAKDLEQKSGFELALLTYNYEGDLTIEQYANRLYENWGIGKKGKDEGALIIIFPKKRKVRIETGYGAEGFLPDVICFQIIKQHMLPNFKKGNYALGTLQGFIATASVAAKNYGIKLQINDQRYNYSSSNYTSKGKSKISVFKLIIYAIIFLLLLSTPFGRSLLLGMLIGGMLGGRRSSGGGSFGGGFSSGGFGGFGGGMSGGGGASGSW